MKTLWGFRSLTLGPGVRRGVAICASTRRHGIVRRRRETRRLAISERGKSTVQTPIHLAWHGCIEKVVLALGECRRKPTRSIDMQPSEDKTAEQYLSKRKMKVLSLIGICFSVIKVCVQIFTLIDKYWPKLVSFFMHHPD